MPPRRHLAGQPPGVPDAAVLDVIARHAAARAAAILDGAPPAALPLLHQAVALLAEPGAPPAPEGAAERLGTTARHLQDLINAHRCGGPGNVTAAHSPQPADPAVLHAAHSAIQPWRPSPFATLTTSDNRVQDPAARVEIRLVDAQWYPFVEWHGIWRPVTGHSPDPATAYRNGRQALKR
ncbi:hypothetical protein [Kitasatospora sp. NPDC088783]|uniref:hypothetical protein n=1 Tax=Kitasatospora sp. NPDC088783 TaxID=3364077 RepID=UPI00381CDC02